MGAVGGKDKKKIQNWTGFETRSKITRNRKTVRSELTLKLIGPDFLFMKRYPYHICMEEFNEFT